MVKSQLNGWDSCFMVWRPQIQTLVRRADILTVESVSIFFHQPFYAKHLSNCTYFLSFFPVSHLHSCYNLTLHNKVGSVNRPELIERYMCSWTNANTIGISYPAATRGLCDLTSYRDDSRIMHRLSNPVSQKSQIAVWQSDVICFWHGLLHALLSNTSSLWCAQPTSVDKWQAMCSLCELVIR